MLSEIFFLGGEGIVHGLLCYFRQIAGGDILLVCIEPHLMLQPAVVDQQPPETVQDAGSLSQNRKRVSDEEWDTLAY